MSFKRQGDDKYMLDQLRKRRADELLTEAIPDGEAKLLSNGRLACLVCFHNPVFDTINVLHVHRSGKKHLAAYERYLEKQKELADLVVKRQQEEMIKTGTTSTAMPITTAASILPNSCRYNSSHKTKPHQRKRRLCLDDDFHDNPLTTPDNLDSQKSSTDSNFDKLQGSHAIKQPKQLKHIFGPGLRNLETEVTEVRPYVRSFKQVNGNLNRGGPGGSGKLDKGSCGNLGIKIDNNHRPVHKSSFTNYSKLANQISKPKNDNKSKLKNSKNTDKNGGKYTQQKLNESNSFDWYKPRIDQLKAETNNKNLKLLESGWKKDRGGEWVKDVNCEFDSDEDDPN